MHSGFTTKVIILNVEKDYKWERALNPRVSCDASMF